MIDLIRAAAVPPNLMQSAARGSLSIPAPEMIEILVHLAKHNSAFAQQAALTLAAWDETSAKAAAANPATSREVLEYFASSGNLRPALLPLLLANPAISEETLAALGGAVSREDADTFLASERAGKSRVVLSALASNPNLSGIQSAQIEERISQLNPETKARAAAATTSGGTVEMPAGKSPGTIDIELPDHHDAEVKAFLNEHAGEISAEGEKSFQPIGGIHEEAQAEPAPAQAVDAKPAVPVSEADATAAPAKAPTSTKKSVLTAEEQRGSALQKISKLDITGRIQLAMKGTKEERALLIRDGTKIVALAVLESPKVSDGEVEKFASQKNVLEAVLRAIPLKRRFMKNYNVVRNLVFNPRTPIDLSLGLMKNLMVNDLKNLASNKEVSETIRKLALRQFRQKNETQKRD